MSTAKFHTARGFRAQCQAASGPVPLRPEFSPCSIAKGVSRFPQPAPRKLGDGVEERAAQDPTFLCRSQDGKGTVRCFPVILRYDWIWHPQNLSQMWSQTSIHVSHPRPLGGREMASGVQTWLEAQQMARDLGF